MSDQSKASIEEIRVTLKRFFKDNNRDHKKILVDKMKLLEQENLQLTEEIQTLNDFH